MSARSGTEDDLLFAVETARTAGALLVELRRSAIHVTEKRDRTLITDADLASEELILSRIRTAYPDHGILSEEAGERADGRRRWIVDPLDGTTNYSRGLPFFAVSLALWDGDTPLAGVVYLPVLDEMFAAASGMPATLNGEPIAVSTIERLQDAMINVYFDRHHRLAEGLEIFRRVALRCEGRMKMLGSTASLLCYVACGRLDGFIRNTTKIWDFAAGALIARQAGGVVGDFDGAPLVRSGQSVAASNGRIHEELVGAAIGQQS